MLLGSSSSSSSSSSGEVQRQKASFCHCRSLEQVDGEKFYLYDEKRPRRNFLIDISRRLLNELKRGWICRAHYIPEKPSVTLLTQGKSSPRRKSEENAKKHMLFRINKRYI